MVGSNGTMIAIRLVRSKLRKREEHSNSVHPADVLQTTAPVATAQPPVPQALQADPLTYQGQFLWPPPPQPYLYNNDQVGAPKKRVPMVVGKYRRVAKSVQNFLE